jgi:hypothetical protein
MKLVDQPADLEALEKALPGARTHAPQRRLVEAGKHLCQFARIRCPPRIDEGVAPGARRWSRFLKGVARGIRGKAPRPQAGAS